MAARASVPQFGNWDQEDNVPYTVYFDNARKSRGGKMINPNDPQENPDMFHPPLSINKAPQAEEPIGRGAARQPHERRTSRDNLRQLADSAAAGCKTAGESPHHHSGHGSHSGRPTRQSAGSDHSFERSPVHSHHQAKLTGKGSNSPAWEGKNSYDGSYGTHGKSRMKPVTRVDASPDRGGAAVPRFGEWDEKNPQSADNYTHIFNQVREERHNVPSNVPAGNNHEPSYNTTTPKQNANSNRKGGCFPCFGI